MLRTQLYFERIQNMNVYFVFVTNNRDLQQICSNGSLTSMPAYLIHHLLFPGWSSQAGLTVSYIWFLMLYRFRSKKRRAMRLTMKRMERETMKTRLIQRKWKSTWFLVKSCEIISAGCGHIWPSRNCWPMRMHPLTGVRELSWDRGPWNSHWMWDLNWIEFNWMNWTGCFCTFSGSTSYTALINMLTQLIMDFTELKFILFDKDRMGYFCWDILHICNTGEYFFE